MPEIPTTNDIVQYLVLTIFGAGGGGLLVLTIIQLASKYKPLSWIMRKVGDALTVNVMNKVDAKNEAMVSKIAKDIGSISDKVEQYRVEDAIALRNLEESLLKKMDAFSDSNDKSHEAIRQELVAMEKNLLDTIYRHKRESDFKDGAERANTIRLTIMTVVKNMRDHDYHPEDAELAAEYYKMCLWYIDFCKNHDKGAEFVYENDAMVDSCNSYMTWYRKNKLKIA